MARKNREENQQFEDLSSYSSSKEYKKRKKNRRGRAVLRGFAVALCLLFILCGSGLVYVSTDLLDGLTTTTIAKDNEDPGHRPRKRGDGRQHQEHRPLWGGFPQRRPLQACPM